MTEAAAPQAKPRDISVSGLLIGGSLLLLAALTLSSGIGISEARLGGSWLGWLALETPWSLLQRWHLALGAMLAAAILARLVFLWRCGRWSPAQRRARSPKTTLGSVRMLLAVLLWVLLAMLIASGMLGWSNSDSSAVHGFMAWHRGATWALLVAAVFYLLIRLLQLGSQWRPRAVLVNRHHREGLLALGAFCWSLAAFNMIERSLVPELPVPRVIKAPTLDGVADDAVWQRAVEVSLFAFNLEDGRSLPLRLRAVRDHQRVYFLLQWPDSHRSLRHMPLRKTADGWVLTETQFRQGREVEYHEDGLAILLAPDRFVGGSATLRGELAVDPGAPVLAQSGDGELLADYWYWGSVRSSLHGQADDRALIRDREGRVLQVPDPSTGGGVARNFELWRGTRLVGVRRVPSDPESLRLRLGAFKKDPAVSDVMPWILRQSESRPYRIMRDDLEPGTMLPSLIDRGPLGGSRGDVTARGEWRNGWWSVELARAPRGSSAADLSLGDGSHLSLALFDREQRGSYRHFLPLRLVFD